MEDGRVIEVAVKGGTGKKRSKKNANMRKVVRR